MAVTVSIPPGLAYGDSGALPDMPASMDIADAIYHLVHSYPGGVAALAARMGVPASTLTHKANPNNTTHHAHPKELIAMQHLSGNAAPLHSMAAALGYACTRALPDASGGDPVEAFMHLQLAIGDYTRALADPWERIRREPHAPHVTRNESRRVEDRLQDLIAAANHAAAVFRAHGRPTAPGVEG